MTPLLLSVSLAVSTAVVSWEVDFSEFPPKGSYPDEYDLRVRFCFADGRSLDNIYESNRDTMPSNVEYFLASHLQKPQWSGWRSGPLKVVMSDLRGVRVTAITFESNGPKPIVRPVFRKPDKK